MKIHLNSKCILKVPLRIYTDSFIFHVNGEEYKTNKLISDLLSPNICKIHLNDPTFDEITINTHQQGNFQNILKLINFNQNDIPLNDLPFIYEVLKILGNEFIDINDPTELIEINDDNIFTLISEHEQISNIYSKRLKEEIEYISSHFYDLCETREEEIKNLKISTLYDIINNKKLQLKSENQLLKFINKLYSNNSQYSVLYEAVVFNEVSSKAMNEFIQAFDMNDITSETWRKISNRLTQKIELKYEVKSKIKRYRQQGKLFVHSEKEEFSGIIKYLQNSNNESQIDFTSSSIESNAEHHHPRNVALFDDQNKNFCSENIENSWICFDFKKHRIIPNEYSIRSRNGIPNWYHPKSWVIECSNDNNSWEIIDEEKNCSFLNGKRMIHTFKIEKQKIKKYRYMRMRSTGPDWFGANYLTMETFEIYGSLI